MEPSEALMQEIKALIIEALVLEDLTLEDIETDGALFVEGLGLDSIDALELAMVLEERYGVTLEEDPDDNRKIFESVRTISTFVARTGTSPP